MGEGWGPGTTECCEIQGAHFSLVPPSAQEANEWQLIFSVVVKHKHGQ